jgi:hypothetical protein
MPLAKLEAFSYPSAGSRPDAITLLVSKPIRSQIFGSSKWC